MVDLHATKDIEVPENIFLLRTPPYAQNSIRVNRFGSIVKIDIKINVLKIWEN
jgi:hypothetical protein